MPDTKECPLCGCSMRLRRSEVALKIPGHAKLATHTMVEWVCPDCDYFEEAEEE